MNEDQAFVDVPALREPPARASSPEVSDDLDAAARLAAAAKDVQQKPVLEQAVPRQRWLLQRAMREGVIIALLTAMCAGGVRWYMSSQTSGKLVLTPQQLARFDGVRSRRIYLAVVGEVFDVTKGAKHYGPGASYHGAAGRDASKSFITGDFQKGASDDLTGHTPEELTSVHRWRDFFCKHKEYKHVGKVSGRYFSQKGVPTPEQQRIEAISSEAAAQATATAKPDADTACNVQWSAKEGKTVWCPPGKGFPRTILDSTGMDRCVCSPTTVASAAV